MYNRESRIMRKLLGKTGGDSGPGGDLGALTGPTTPIQATYRPSKSQNGVYPSGVPILCFDVAPDRRGAILGGPHILKTVVVEGSGFSPSDGIDLRAAITTRQAAANPRASVVADQLNIRDVKWHASSTIFTACASGKIFAYDLARLGPAAGPAEPLDYIQMQEDSRQVNSLDVNPHLKSWLLSGSQDGTARIFDVSMPLQSRSGMLTFRQRFAPLRCIDSVRQVQWSPRVGHELACCTESGVVLKWDARQPARPLLRINAHEKACSAIAWHPDGTHLMSAGWDTKLHVWDLGSNADKRQKPKWTISTPAPVSAVAWRPPLWSATAQTRRAAQVAVAYDETSSRRYGASAVHIWDLARPTMPYKEIERFDTSPAALMWQDQDMLWTVGQDGLFNQCDVAFAPKVLDRQSTSAMAFSPRGHVLMFLDERPQSQRPRPSVTHEPEASHRQAYTTSPNAPMLSVSRSDSEEEVMATFLGPRRRTASRRRPGGRSGVPLSSTPPSGPALPDDSKQTLNLEQSVAVTGVFKSHQAMASGRIPAAKSVHVYQYLSNAYLETLAKELPYVEGGKPLVDRVGAIMEQFARAAENASLYRLAQTWRILAYVVALLLKRRAQYHLECRRGQFAKLQSDDAKGSARPKPSDMYNGNGEDTPRRQSTHHRGSVDGRLHSRSLLAEEIESTSNVPTPIARPADSAGAAAVAGGDDGGYQYGRKLMPIVEPESLNLGPAAHGSFQESVSPRGHVDSGSASVTSRDSETSQVSSTEGYDFYDAEILAKAIDVPPPKRDASWGHEEPAFGGRAARHGSGESFGQMFSMPDRAKRSAARNSFGDAFAKPGISRKASDTDKSSAASSVEYHSRIRGQGMTEDSAAAPRTFTGSQGAKTAAADSPEEVFMISQTTARSNESYPSQPSPREPGGREDDVPRPVSVADLEPSRASGPPRRPSYSPKHDPSPHMVENDYLPWDDDPPYPHPLQSDGPRAAPVAAPPLDPYSLLTRVVSFETRTSALNASAMVLLLKPLVPESVLDGHQARAILRQQHARLMGMSLFVEAALLRNLCVRGWPEGLPGWGDNYTAIFAPAQQGVTVGLLCPGCRKPRERDPAAGDLAVWTCERCRRVMAPCAVCGHREPERPAQVPAEIAGGADPGDAGAWLSEWWCCPGCAHGGHASCLQTWHAALAGSGSGSGSGSGGGPAAKYSDGCCPADGCGHACLPGKYRGEASAARADEVARAAADAARARDEAPAPAPAPPSQQKPHQPQAQRPQAQTHRADSRRPSPHRAVAADAHDVPPSRAVGVAREALMGGHNGGGGGLSSSPGGERERRKSVKFARTADRG